MGPQEIHLRKRGKTRGNRMRPHFYGDLRPREQREVISKLQSLSKRIWDSYTKAGSESLDRFLLA